MLKKKFTIWIKGGYYLILWWMFVFGLAWLLSSGLISQLWLTALIYNIFSLALLGFSVAASYHLGRLVLRVTRVHLEEEKLFITICIVLGLGIISYWILFIGLLGFLNQTAVWLSLLVLSFLSRYDRNFPGFSIKGIFIRWKEYFKQLESLEKIVFLISVLILILILIHSLTPPWDYDGLLYHLQGPRLFIERNRIYPTQENWLTNFPFTIEMLFTLGLRLGSEVYAKLLNYLLSVLLLIITYQFAMRYLNRTIAVWSAVILLGIPIFPIWASLAYVDMGWSVFVLLSIYLVFRWAETDNHQLLVLAGVFTGLGLGTKYLAISSFTALLLLIIWTNRNSKRLHSLRDLINFIIPAILIALPWYLKNLIWTGDPVYPFISSILSKTPFEVDLWIIYMRSFGTGNTFWDYIFLPINLYLQHEKFSTFLGSIEIPSILFGVVLFYPFVKKNHIVNSLFILSFVQFSFWAAGSQQTRFLLPIFPILCIISAYIFLELGAKLRNKLRPIFLLNGLSTGMLCVSLIYVILYTNMVNPLPVVIGTEKTQSFLNRRVGTYPAIEFIQHNLKHQDRVLMLWDGQGYYCDDRCLPDVSHSRWTAMVATMNDVSAINEELKKMGVTHILLGKSEVDFISQHDPNDFHQNALTFFLDEFQPKCTVSLFSSEYSELVKLSC